MGSRKLSMKNFGKLAVLGAVLAVSATYANASSIIGQLSITGSDSYNPTSIAFIGSGNLGALITIQGSSFTPYYTAFQTVGLTSFTFSPLTAPQQAFQVVENSETLTYFLTSLQSPLFNTNGDLTLMGSGYPGEIGGVNYDQTPGTFNLTSQAGQNGVTTNVTFSDTSYSVPEI